MSQSIPKTTLDTLNEVAAGYNKIADAGGKITDEEVAEVRDVSEDNARRQKKFFTEIGVLEKDGHDHHLTDSGHELGRLIRFNKEDDAGEIYRELLDGWEPTEEILAHVDDGGISLDELADNVALVTANELSTNRKERGAKTVVELLVWAGYLDESDGTYFPSDEVESSQEVDENSTTQEPTPEESEVADVEPVEPEVSGNGGVQSVGQTAQSNGIYISLDVSGDDDPENVRELLLAIRQGTQEDVDEFDIGKADD